MSSLLDLLKEQITPDVIRGLASSLGESGDAVQNLRVRLKNPAFSVKS
jgi:hypothetical protein